MEEIILGFDGTPDARRALAVAADFAREGARLTVVTAVHVPVLVGYPPKTEREVGMPDHEPLTEAAELLKGLGVEAEYVESKGEPEAVLIGEAIGRKADLIVVGTRNLSGTQRVLHDSVSTKLVHEAPCSVLVVR